MGFNLLAEPRNSRPNEMTAMAMTRDIASSATTFATRKTRALTTAMMSGKTTLKVRLTVRSGRL